MSEADYAAQLAAARVARKQTNKGCAVEELAKTAAGAAQRRAADAASEDDKDAVIADNDAVDIVDGKSQNRKQRKQEPCTITLRTHHFKFMILLLI